MSALAIIRDVERACALLASAKTLDEVLRVHDKARALKTYAGLRAKGSQAHADAWELCKLAERRLGELLAALPKASPGRKKSITPVIETLGPKPKREVLLELDIAPEQGRRYEATAREPLPAFNDYLATGAAALAKGKAPPSFAAVSGAAGYDGDEYGTPPAWVDPGREVLGGIDLDVACNTDAALITRPARFYTKQDSALTAEASWKARTVWMNPPYSEELIDAFVGRFLREWSARSFDAGIALTNLDAVAWHAKLLRACDAFILPEKRIAFLLGGKPIKSNRYAQTLFYFGPEPDEFLDAYSHLGTPCKTALVASEAS